MSDLKINNITDRTGDSGPVIAGVSTVSSTGAFTVPVGPTEYRGGRGRGVVGGGNNPAINSLEYVTIATTGNAQDFGDSDVPVDVPAGAANLVRGIVAGGYAPAPTSNDTSNISMLTIETLGNTTTWGTLSSARRNRDGCGDHSRGLFMSGYSTTAQIDYLTFMSTGTSIDFGDTTQSIYNPAAVSDSTRAVCCLCI